MTKDLECIYCDTAFSIEACANFTVICPCCKRSIYLECEYGYGPVTPCRIYLGSEIAGVVESQEADYHLHINRRKIRLAKTYLDAITEAEEIVKKRLHIVRPCKDLRILTKGGSLCFYGDWFGRPYDNCHKIVRTHYDGEILEIQFEQSERLLVYNPEGITSMLQELRIEKASKLKWLYIPYGVRTTEYHTITYTMEDGTLFKETAHGKESLSLDGASAAVSIG
ncbi:MAG: hypothetical protein HDR11_04950 [Lachnospiraceae bacterium]|nr:hypothetical protein [Lachnospiraceae bacterium]